MISRCRRGEKGKQTSNPKNPLELENMYFHLGAEELHFERKQQEKMSKGKLAREIILSINK